MNNLATYFHTGFEVGHCLIPFVLPGLLEWG